jgi:hypothetical protein
MFDLIQLKNSAIIFTSQNTKIINLPTTLYRRQTWSLTLTKEHNSQPLDNGIQGKYLDLNMRAF